MLAGYILAYFMRLLIGHTCTDKQILVLNSNVYSLYWPYFISNRRFSWIKMWLEVLCMLGNFTCFVCLFSFCLLFSFFFKNRKINNFFIKKMFQKFQ